MHSQHTLQHMHVCPALLLLLFTLQIVIPFHTGNQRGNSPILITEAANIVSTTFIKQIGGP